MSAVGTGPGISILPKNAIPGGGPPFQLNSAYNGLSVDPITGQIVLGDDLGLTGPADLVSDREIDLASFIFRMSQTNTVGFHNWELSLFNNFMGMNDTVTNTKFVYWNVDFAGNTGTVIGNDRTEPGWNPPFLVLQDSIIGTSGRVQYNLNDAIELADSPGGNAISLFTNTGNVGVQPAGQADTGWRFDIDSIGNTNLFRVHDTGQPFLLLDEANNLYQFGNTVGNFNLSMDGNVTQTATIQQPGRRMLEINLVSETYGFGDLDAAVNGTTLFIADGLGAQNVQINALNGLLISNDTVMLHSGTGWADGAGAAVGTLLNAPAAGNPTKWIPVDDNGTTRFIPAW